MLCAVLKISCVFDTPQMWSALLLTHAEPGVDQHPQTPLCRDAPQTFLSPFLFVPCTAPPRCRIYQLELSDFIPSITAQCPNLYRPLSKASCPSREPTATPHFGTISEIAKDVFKFCIQIADKYIEQDCPQK